MEGEGKAFGVSPGEQLCCLLYPAPSRSAWAAGGSPKAEHHPPDQQAGVPGPEVTSWACGRTTNTEDEQKYHCESEEAGLDLFEGKQRQHLI